MEVCTQVSSRSSHELLSIGFESSEHFGVSISVHWFVCLPDNIRKSEVVRASLARPCIGSLAGARQFLKPQWGLGIQYFQSGLVKSSLASSNLPGTRKFYSDSFCRER
jgi:hypothetical protein